MTAPSGGVRVGRRGRGRTRSAGAAGGWDSWSWRAAQLVVRASEAYVTSDVKPGNYGTMSISLAVLFVLFVCSICRTIAET